MDFSETAMKALHTAIAIANRNGKDLRIVHVVPYSYEGHDVATNVAKDKLLQLIDKVRNTYTVENGTLDYAVFNGTVADELINKVRYDETSLVVMGSHGVSGLTKNWIGGNAYKMICNCVCPVMLIRPDMTYNDDFGTCVVPVNINKSSRCILPKVADIIKFFDSRVMVIGIQSTTLSYVYNRITSAMKQVVNFFKSRSFNVYKTDNIVDEKWSGRLLSTLVEQDADLVTVDVMNYGFFVLDRFKPDLTTIINYSKCPVLVVPSK